MSVNTTDPPNVTKVSSFWGIESTYLANYFGNPSQENFTQVCKGAGGQGVGCMVWGSLLTASVPDPADLPAATRPQANNKYYICIYVSIFACIRLCDLRLVACWRVAASFLATLAMDVGLVVAVAVTGCVCGAALIRRKIYAFVPT